MYLANSNLAPSQSGLKMHLASEFIDPFYPRFWPERLSWFLPRYAGSRHLHTPRGIFVCDMSDLFGIGVPEEWTRRVLRAPELWPEHRFYLLTKQPQNLTKFSPFPDNCWVGVSATNRTQATLAQHYLYEVEARVKYISFEPLLEDMTKARLHLKGLGNRIDWVIIGAQTKPYKPPRVEWVREIIEACDKAGVPMFIKHNMNSENLPDNAFNKEGLVRQELPR